LSCRQSLRRDRNSERKLDSRESAASARRTAQILFAGELSAGELFAPKSVTDANRRRRAPSYHFGSFELEILLEMPRFAAQKDNFERFG
jgi:hypothetical protein